MKAWKLLEFLHTIWWLDALKRIETITRKNALELEKKKHKLKRNPGLALIGPGWCDSVNCCSPFLARVQTYLTSMDTTLKIP